jgi:DNA-binding GntR family transcriptional regulator
LLECDLGNQSLDRLLEKYLRLKLGWGREMIACCNAPKYVATVLHIRPGTAVITSDRYVFLEDGIPVDYMNAYTRSDLFKLRFDVRR